MVSSSIPSLITSFFAGLLSFLSPCVLPLIPVYLSFITGESTEDLKSNNVNKGAVFLRTTAFVLGFTIVFVGLAFVFGGGMKLLGSGVYKIINVVAGLIIIVLAANFLFDFIPFLRVEVRSSADTSSESGISFKSGTKSFLLGVSFAAGWTPCIGPILSTILLYAGSSGNVFHSATLLVFYSIGFALPFFLAGLFFGKFLPVLTWFKKHFKAVKIVSAALLLFFGILMLTGSFSNLPILISKTGYWFENLSETGPHWFKPIAKALSSWFLFTGL